MFQAAFQHYLKIYQGQNPSLDVREAVRNAECTWSKLSPKYKKMYGPRVYTPSQLSPSPEFDAPHTCNGEQCEGIGKTLVSALTHKLITSCRDNLISPRYRKLLRHLIGSEVTVKVCDVRK